MIHTFEGWPSEARAKHPNAALIRALNERRCLVFDNLMDAKGHPSSQEVAK